MEKKIKYEVKVTIVGSNKRKWLVEGTFIYYCYLHIYEGSTNGTWKYYIRVFHSSKKSHFIPSHCTHLKKLTHMHRISPLKSEKLGPFHFD